MSVRTVTVVPVSGFQPGDHIKVDCKYFNHHAIFVAWQSINECVAMVIQHNGKNGNNSTIERCQENVEKFRLVVRPKNPSQVLERAYSREGSAGYNLLFRNCEHFCNWCITGKPISTQIMRHSTRMGGKQVVASASPVLGNAIVASELSWEAVQNIRSYLRGEISAKSCAKAVLNAGMGVGGGLAGAAAGATAGRLVGGGRVGGLVGAVVGGVVGQHLSGRMADQLTRRLLVESRDEAVVEAYHILQVEPNATNDEINTAYRHLALEKHPDRPTGSKQGFVELHTAIEIVRVARNME